MTTIETIWNSTNLPSLPTIAVQLLDLSNDPEAELTDYIRIVRADPAISTKIIRAANSSYFGLSKEVTTIESAIPLLGSTIITSLALSFSLVAENEGPAALRPHYQAFWSQALVQAVTAETLARSLRTSTPAEAFLSGLLCDIGILAQLRSIPEVYWPILERVRETGTSLIQVESEQLGFDHREVGSTLMTRWHLPSILIEVAKSHHNTLEEIDGIDDKRLGGLLRAIRFSVAVSEYLAHHGRHADYSVICALGSALFQLDAAQVNDLLDQVRMRTDDAAQMLSIETSSLGRPADILSRANAQLAEIAMREHAVMHQVSMQSAMLEMENRRLREHNVALHQQAGVDSLTGLNNRGSFDDVFETMISNCLRRGTTVGVIFADVDNFKKLNDNYGHPFGDEVLRGVAKILRAAVRGTDFIARYGGEEFVIIAADCPAAVVNAIAERIRSRVEAEVFMCAGSRVPVTISVGGCVTPQIGAMTSDLHRQMANEMLHQADSAMYQCKRNGRNRILVKQCDRPIATNTSIAT